MPAPIAPLNPSMAPTDKSISPSMIIYVCPIARITVTATSNIILSMLVGVRKKGERIDAIMTSIANMNKDLSSVMDFLMLDIYLTSH